MPEPDVTRRAVAAALAREDLYFFSRWMFLQRRQFNWLRGPHHQIICDALMRVFRGECTRLIINIPPRYSKTELAVINFIAFALGNFPDAEFIHTSYAADLAANNAWQTRELVQHEAYREIFPAMQLRDDSSARDHWKTTEGGVVYAAGSGGTITGFGAGKERPAFGGAIIMDDPHKADEARQDIPRQKVIDRFHNTIESRRNSRRTPIVLIMQRLHENDLAGYLLNGGSGEKWESVCLKALRDDGTALWPEKHTVADLKRMEQASPYNFSGQYQQMPTPPQGGIFKPDMMPIVEAIPSGTKMVRGWDLASVENDGDWTVGGNVGLMPDGRWIIADIVRLQGSPDQVIAALTNTAARDGRSVAIDIPQDPGQAGKSQVAFFTKQLSGYTVRSSPESGDKITRAEPFASQVNVGNVVMLKAGWNRGLVDEMRMFPNGTFDDQVDACSRSFNARRIGALKVTELRI